MEGSQERSVRSTGTPTSGNPRESRLSTHRACYTRVAWQPCAPTCGLPRHPRALRMARTPLCSLPLWSGLNSDPCSPTSDHKENLEVTHLFHLLSHRQYCKLLPEGKWKQNHEIWCNSVICLSQQIFHLSQANSIMVRPPSACGTIRCKIPTWTSA